MHGNVENQKLKLDGVLIVGLKQFFLHIEIKELEFF